MKKRKIIKIILYAISVVALSLLVVMCLHVYRKFGARPDKWVEYFRAFGMYAALVLWCVQVAQVFVAIVPGEVVEISSGLLFDPIFACVLCYTGVFLASSLIFFLMRKLGKRFSRLFVSEAKLQTLRFVNTKEKLKRTAFVLFLIPGTPKDLFTYFFALTPIKFWDFTLISMIARFPSIISSVVGGKFVGDGEYFKAVIVFAITAFVSVAGLLAYELIKKRWEKRKKLKIKK